MSKLTTKKTRKEDKPENIYKRALSEYILLAFADIDPVLREAITDGSDALTVSVFINGGKDEKASYFNPIPHSLGPILHFLTLIHQRIVSELSAENSQFLEMIKNIGLPKSQVLRDARETTNAIDANIRQLAIGTSKYPTTEVGLITDAAYRIVKIVAEVIVDTIIMYKRLPTRQDCIVSICQVARFPGEIMKIAMLAVDEFARKSKKKATNSQNVISQK